MSIAIGSMVRSFDFASEGVSSYGRDLEGPRAAYVEGVVEEIGDFLGYKKCTQYKIRCTKRVFGGETIPASSTHYYPPVNGTRPWRGKPTSYVEEITDELCSSCY